MFMGPFEGSLPWSMDNIIGSRRFLDRVWRLFDRIGKVEEPNLKLTNLLQHTVSKVTNDIGNFSFNTAISSMMILLNEMDKQKNILKKDFELLLKILSPFAPHITQELWRDLGHKSFITEEKWPKSDPRKMVELEVNIVIQINGRVRAECLVQNGAKESEVLDIAKSSPDVEKWLIGKEIKKVIYIQNKLLNLVVV